MGMVLETWIDRLLKQSDQDLDGLYLDEETTYTEVESLLAPADVRDETLVRLHQRLRGKVCEGNVWAAIISSLQKPLPVPIAHDLIDRDIAMEALGHSRQADTIQWRTASLYDEALLTLALDLYTNPQRHLTELQALFQLFPDHRWMLETLVRRNPSDPEKEHALLTLIATHAEAGRLLKIYHAHADEMLARDPDLCVEKLEDLFRSGEPSVLRVLAAHPRTPTRLLVELANMRNIKFARYIRQLAKQSLNSRKRDDQ